MRRMRRCRAIGLILLLALTLTGLPSCGEEVFPESEIPAGAILAVDELEAMYLSFYGVVRLREVYYVRVLTEPTEVPGEDDFRYAPLADVLDAQFQPDGWLGAWSPVRYETAEALALADRAGEITRGVRFTYAVTDGRIDYLAEHNGYADGPTDVTTGLLRDDYDLPVDEVPALLPDVLGLRENHYDSMNTFSTQTEVNEFALWNFFWGRDGFECYLTRELAPDEGRGYAVLSEACASMAVYYLFSAYTEFDMFTRDDGDARGVYAKVKLAFVREDLDLEARAEALEYVRKHPVPEGGFTDFWEERDYARGIHDYLACKVTYSPIGYDPQAMFGLDRYTNKQEAYTCLGEDQHETVCAGYARAFALIAHYAGINVAWVRGNVTADSGHAWNVLYPCDGREPVLIDVTWDDTESFDEPGQTMVSDRWFYMPLADDTEHEPLRSLVEFLDHLNAVKLPAG